MGRPQTAHFCIPPQRALPLKDLSLPSATWTPSLSSPSSPSTPRSSPSPSPSSPTSSTPSVTPWRSKSSRSEGRRCPRLHLLRSCHLCLSPPRLLHLPCPTLP